MATIPIKKNKKGTFLDLSKEDLNSENFSENFSKFTDQVANFLSGTSVSIILADELKAELENDLSIVGLMKSELNKNNISLKTILSSSQNMSESGLEASDQHAPKTETELINSNEDKELIDTSSLPETLYVEANLRSGQLIRYPGNVFIMGDVNPSAEVIAFGDIIIWGTLRGIAHAGANGDKSAKLIAMDIGAGQIRIANNVVDLSNRVREKKLKDKNKTGIRIPELVKIENDEIIINRYFC